MVKAMKRVALSKVKDDLSKYLRQAENEEIIITRHGKPAGVLVGFASEDDWFDYKLEHDPRFLQRIAQARASLKAGKGIKLEDLQSEPRARSRRTVIWPLKSSHVPSTGTDC
jgi:prevent-host-death family protein